MQIWDYLGVRENLFTNRENLMLKTIFVDACFEIFDQHCFLYFSVQVDTEVVKSN